MILEIKDKPSVGKFISGGAVYLQDDRTVSQTDSAVLTCISQSTRPSNKEGIWRSEGTSKALIIRNRVRNEGEEIDSQICGSTPRIGTRQGGRQIWIGKNQVFKEESKNCCKIFYIYGSVHRWSILTIVQRVATQSSLFIILQVHCTCFGCQPHPSSGVHKLAWPRWREVAAHYRRL